MSTTEKGGWRITDLGSAVIELSERLHDGVEPEPTAVERARLLAKISGSDLVTLARNKIREVEGLQAIIGFAFSELRDGPAAELCDLYGVVTPENRDALCRVRERLRQAITGR